MAQEYLVTIRCDSQFGDQVFEAVRAVDHVGDVSHTLGGRESTIEIVTTQPEAVQDLGILTLANARVNVAWWEQ